MLKGSQHLAMGSEEAKPTIACMHICAGSVREAKQYYSYTKGYRTLT